MCVCVCVCVRVYIYMCVCVCVCVYTHTYHYTGITLEADVLLEVLIPYLPLLHVFYVSANTADVGAPLYCLE
jgi:hypothetical protein